MRVFKGIFIDPNDSKDQFFHNKETVAIVMPNGSHVYITTWEQSYMTRFHDKYEQKYLTDETELTLPHPVETLREAIHQTSFASLFGDNVKGFQIEFK